KGMASAEFMWYAVLAVGHELGDNANAWYGVCGIRHRFKQGKPVFGRCEEPQG
ncbi:MAG: hypothetical protein Q9204_007614, partial [Flavoplaca sp. TL-2023a]